MAPDRPLKRHEVHLFWKTASPFSQWHPATFEVDGVVYNCAEQYMMAEKARLFGDYETEAAILASGNPGKQKALGRKVANFDETIWNERCRDVVFQGNLAKFSQNPDLMSCLLDTADRILVEASPVDAVWGIGLAEDDPRCLEPAQWRGTNWLGEVLTAVRAHIRESLGK